MNKSLVNVSSVMRVVIVGLTCLLVFSQCQFFTFTVTVNYGTGGVVTLSPQKTRYFYNDVVAVTAIPDDGYQFSVWGGALTGNQNPTSISITANTNIVANWVEDETGDGGFAISEVTSLEAAEGNGYVTLSWQEPGDAAFAGVQITFTPTASGVDQPIEISKGTESANISGLVNGTSYNFVVVAVDTDGNTTEGVTIQATPVATTSENVVSPSVSLNDTTNYVVESAWIGKSYSSSTYIYGLIKIKYLGTTNRMYVNVSVVFKNSAGSTIWTDGGFLRNTTVANSGSSNTNTFLTPTYNIGYYYIIEDLSTYNASVGDISSVDLVITNSSSTYAPPQGHLSTSGVPYNVESDSWYQGITNDGDRTVTESFSRFIFEDSSGRQYHWTFPGTTVEGVDTNDIEVGQNGHLSALYVSPDYVSEDLDFGVASLSWEDAAESAPTLSASIGDVDQIPSNIDEYNALLLRMANELETKKLQKAEMLETK